MQAVTLEVILRASSASDAGAARLARGSATCSRRRLDRAAVLGAASRRLAARSARAAAGAGAGHRRAAAAGDRRSGGADPGEDICSLLVAARFEDGGRWKTTRSATADDAAARRPRDDGHRPRVDDRPARAPPGRARARSHRAATTPTCAPSSPSRCGCARWCRSPAAGWRSSCDADGLLSRPAPTSPPRSGSPTRARTSYPEP